MKTLIFADTHLTHIFDERKYKFLRSVISKADQVIINGDFWDYYFTTFNLFTESKWNQLFPLLKRKNTTYLYGNHDNPKYINHKVDLFSTKQDRKVNLKVGSKDIIVTHGEIFSQGLDVFKDRYPAFVQSGSKAYTNLEKVSRFFLKEYFAIGRITNLRTKKYASKFLNSNEILVCGHSHNYEFSPGKKYINVGLVDFNMGQYLVIDNDRMELKNEKY